MNVRRLLRASIILALAAPATPAIAQRVLGLDVSAWQGDIAQATWNDLYNIDNRQFAFLRATRGGTTGTHPGGGPGGGGDPGTLSRRYDDPYFVQNITQATDAGLFAGSYHFSRPDVVGNTGADEADHFMEMAGAWMRPGYLPPVLDLETGSGSEHLAQFSIDFSNRIYDVMGIRPAIYISGNYSNILQGASFELRSQLAQPLGATPSVVSPAFSVLWNPRWPTSPDVQTNHPQDTSSLFYGPWDDFGEWQPWDFWQYTSSGVVTDISPVDLNVSRGDVEYVKDMLIPAVWMNDSSGDWGALLNWNSGQPTPPDPQDPAPAAGQVARYGPWTPPAARLPGAAGSGPTSGRNDTVILERPDADITVTISSGDHDVRKLYMRESLEISGGSLTINYDPNYATPADEIGSPLYPNAMRSGWNSAQFSGAATLSGSGSLTVDTLWVDESGALTLAGSTGELSFRRIELYPAYNWAPAVIALTGDVNITPLNDSEAVIGGYYGFVDLHGGDRTINLSDGGSEVDLSIDMPIDNGALTKSGPGTLRLSSFNSYAGGTTVEAGGLLVGYGSTGDGAVTVNGGVLGGHGYVFGDVILNGGALAPGESIGSMYVQSAIFNASGTLDYEYDSSLSLAADQLNIALDLTIDPSAKLNLANLGSGPMVRGTKLALITYEGNWNDGVFDGFANNSVFNHEGIKFRIQYDDDPTDAVNGWAYNKGVTLTAINGPIPVTIDGFVDHYAPANWTVTDFSANGGSIEVGGAPHSVVLSGPDDGSRVSGEIGFSIQVPVGGTFSFDWSYFSDDSAGYDYAYYVNGYYNYLTTYDGESGHVSVPVFAGDTIGWVVYSTDSVNGPGVLTISNFSAPGLSIPEPGAALLLATAVIPLLACVARRPQLVVRGRRLN
jgi:autotransporter-associated beta strand protein